MSDWLSKWLAHYDPLHRGRTPRGIANGVCATNGFCFPRIGGGYNLYRGPVGEAIDEDQPAGAAGSGRRTITTFRWRPGAAATTYRYVLKAIGGGGVESEPSAPAVVAYDDEGIPLGHAPLAPRDLIVCPIDGGRFELRWRYPRGARVLPASFAVYSDAGSGAVDYAAPVGSVPYRHGAGWYRWRSAAYAHDLSVIFAVRAVSADAVDDGNTDTARASARAGSPAALEGVAVYTTEEG